MNLQINPLPPSTDLRAADADEPQRRSKFLAGGGLALVLALGGFWYLTHEAPTKTKHVLAAPVKVGQVEQRNMAVVEHTIGTVVANSTVSVNARIQGQMVKAFFKEGQMVKRGDPLFQIDPRPYQAALDNALASLVSAKAKAERYGRLKAQNAVAGQDVDDAQAAYLEAKANAETAQLNLEYTLIHAPVNGKTGPMLIQPGNMVAASTASTNATPLVTLNEIQPVKISVSLPQSDLPRIQAMARTHGLYLTMNMHDIGGEDRTAKVDFISNAVANTTGTIELRATYPNQDLELVPGQMVDVTVALANIPNAIVVPREALNTGPDGQFVYTVTQDSTAREVPVKVAFDDGTDAAVEGALKPGEQVIVDGQLRVVPGAKVTVTSSSKHHRTGTIVGTRTSTRRHVPHASDREG